MTPARYEIVADVAKAVLYVRVWDYWMDEETYNYQREMSRAVTTMFKSMRPWSCVGDVVKSPPQSAGTQKVRHELLQQAARSGMRKMAYIVDNSLMKQQINRVGESTGATIQFFHTRADAEAWVKQP